MKFRMFMVVFSMLALMCLLCSCGKGKVSVDYSPFDGINLLVDGSEGKGVLQFDTSGVQAGNINTINGSKDKDDVKALKMEVVKNIFKNGSYTVSKESGLKNGEQVIISFSLPEKIPENTEINLKESTYTYTVDDLEYLFSEKSDLKDADYETIKSKSQSLAEQYVSKMKTGTVSFTELFFQGQYIIDKGRETGDKSVLTLFHGVKTSTLMEVKEINEFVYVYVVCDVSFGTRGQSVFNYNADDMDIITRQYQTADVNDILYKVYDTVGFVVVDEFAPKMFLTINDLPDGYLSVFDEAVSKEIQIKLKESTYVYPDSVVEKPVYYKCYMKTDYFDAAMPGEKEKKERKSIVMVYKFTSTSPENGTTYFYYFKNVGFFLYDKNNTLVSYKAVNKFPAYPKPLSDEEIVDVFKIPGSAMDEIPF